MLFEVEVALVVEHAVEQARPSTCARLLAFPAGSARVEANPISSHVFMNVPVRSIVDGMSVRPSRLRYGETWSSSRSDSSRHAVRF